MEFTEALKLGLQSLWANKLRTVLTLLGMVIGVSSVITVVTLTNGAKEFVTDKINTYGASVVTVSKMPDTFITMEEYLEFQRRKNVTYDDFKVIEDLCRSCVSVGAQRTTTGKVVYQTKSTTDTSVRGETYAMAAISNLNIEQGRMYTQVEDEHSAHVAVVGYDIVDNVLGPGDPLGKEIRVDGVPYTVVGVVERQGKALGMSMDDWVAVPLTAFLHSYGANDSLTVYINAGGGGEVMDTVEDELRVIMRTRRHLAPGIPDAFSIDSSATFGNMLTKLLNNFGAVVVAIAGVSLVIGGIVIMNIMLVSVTERTREIGVRKALGARRKDILLQFLIESATMSLLGGLIGVALGITMAKLITMAVAFPSVVGVWSIPVSLFVAISVGLFFGVYPAYKASELDPITALRAEL